MTRFAFATWDGGGNLPPAIGIAQELASRGHHLEFIGYEVQRRGFAERGFAFSALRRSGHFDIYGGADPAGCTYTALYNTQLYNARPYSPARRTAARP